MDFSKFDLLPDINDIPDNHPNLPYPLFQIVAGKQGSGKTFNVIKQLLNR